MNTPDCPAHRSPMIMIDGDDLFRCMEPDCTWTAKPTDEALSPVQPATGKAWPEVLAQNTIYQGDVELVCHPESGVIGQQSTRAVYLRLVEQEVMIDLTRYFLDMSTNGQQDYDPDQITNSQMHTEVKFRFQDVRYFG